MSDNQVTAPDPRLGPVRATLVGFALVVLVNAVLLAWSPAPAQGWQVRGLHHLYQAGRILGVALIVAGLVAAATRAQVLGGRRGYLVLGALSLLGGALTLIEDLSGFAVSALPSAPSVALWGLVCVVSGAVVAAAAAGRWCARAPWRAWRAGVAVLLGAAALAMHPFVLADGYPGAHLYLTAAAVTLVASACSDAPLPKWWPSLRAALPWGLAAGIAVFTFTVPPSNSLQLEMLRQEGDVVTPFLSRVAAKTDAGDVEVPAQWEPWFRARTDVPPIPASKPALVKNPIVILVTIDSLRADILTGKHAKSLPTLAKLRDSSLQFTQARAPGSQTVYTIAQFFMGTYYSQQYWAEKPGIRDLWPAEDPTVRFPEILSAAGVPTLNLPTTKWLINDLGLVRGFSEDDYVEPADTRYAISTETFPRLFARLEKVGDGPLFAYTHVLDAHYTVSPRAKKSSAKKKYIANLELVDESMAALLAKIDELGLTDRTILIVSADHGEAFGEHDTHHHRSTLYEELLRVPLLIRGPGIKPREVATPVTVMDIGPTVLDLFGQETPGHWFGESLVGFLRGKDPELTRPILAEGRLKKALIFPDGVKAIVDDRHNTAEVYDLVADPKELTNLLDAGDAGASDRVQVLRHFFEVHRIQREGYTVPFRP